MSRVSATHSHGSVKSRSFSYRREGGNSMIRTFARVTGAVAITALIGLGCSNSMSHQMMHSGMAAAPRSAVATSTSVAMPAADLRTGLNALLSEHVILASAATGAALGGRKAEFQAAAGALNANSVDISRAIGAAYGPDAERAFYGASILGSPWTTRRG
jgi:hypothetical protein